MSYLILFVAIGALWLLQIGLAYRQANRFLAEVASLRHQGRTAVGRSGKGRIGRKTFVALVADSSGRVASAVKLQGVTVFAGPEPAPQFQGQSLAQLASATQGRESGHGTKALDEAAAMAAETLLAPTGRATTPIDHREGGTASA